MTAYHVPPANELGDQKDVITVVAESGLDEEGFKEII